MMTGMTTPTPPTPARPPRRVNPWLARAAGVALSLGALLAAPQAALAQQAEGEEGIDARIRGYTTEVALPAGNTALTWLLFAFITICGLSVLFKNAKRTHLD